MINQASKGNKLKLINSDHSSLPNENLFYHHLKTGRTCARTVKISTRGANASTGCAGFDRGRNAEFYQRILKRDLWLPRGSENL